MKKIFAIILSLACFFSFVSCSEPNSGATSEEKESTPPVEDVAEVVEMERDYVYAWNKSGVGGVDKIVNVQTEKYALTTNAVSGGITSIGGYISSESGKFARCDFSQLFLFHC